MPLYEPSNDAQNDQSFEHRLIRLLEHRLMHHLWWLKWCLFMSHQMMLENDPLFEYRLMRLLDRRLMHHLWWLKRCLFMSHRMMLENDPSFEHRLIIDRCSQRKRCADASAMRAGDHRAWPKPAPSRGRKLCLAQAVIQTCFMCRTAMYSRLRTFVWHCVR